MATSALRHVRVGDQLPRTLVDRHRPRRLEATALMVHGLTGADAYVAGLEARAGDFADWDGRLVILDSDGEPTHRLAIVDRYGQVYAVHDAADATELPDAGALSEWFRFLATACPECGVLDEAVLAGPTP